eukprot:jgi/Chrpa1/15360/Chrysochromulina_OHIO_Genome00009552-RA
MDVPQAPAHSRFTQSHGDEYLQQQQQGKGGGKGARGMGRRRWASNGSPVREWLLRQAAVHPCFADQVLAVLEAEEVLSLEDLRLLAGHNYFDSCGLSVINVLKIRKALLEDEDDEDEGMGRGSGGEGMSELDMAAATPLFLARTLSEQLSDEIAMADKETADTTAKNENKDKKLRGEGTGNLEGGRGKGGGKGRHGKGIGGKGKGGMGKGGLF